MVQKSQNLVNVVCEQPRPYSNLICSFALDYTISSHKFGQFLLEKMNEFNQIPILTLSDSSESLSRTSHPFFIFLATCVAAARALRLPPFILEAAEESSEFLEDPFLPGNLMPKI